MYRISRRLIVFAVFVLGDSDCVITSIYRARVQYWSGAHVTIQTDCDCEWRECPSLAFPVSPTHTFTLAGRASVVGQEDCKVYRGVLIGSQTPVCKFTQATFVCKSTKSNVHTSLLDV